MTLKEYLETRRGFKAKGFHFQVVPVGPTGYRLVVRSTAGPNRTVTNGIWDISGFQAFMPKSESALNIVANVLAEEARAYGVTFTLDDSMNKQDDRGVFLYYKIRKLRSPVIT